MNSACYFHSMLPTHFTPVLIEVPLRDGCTSPPGTSAEAVKDISHVSGFLGWLHVS